MSLARSRPILFSASAPDGEINAPAAAEYRRRARQLRHRYRNDPLRLHQSLRTLAGTTAASDNSDAVARVVQPIVEHPLRVNPIVAAAFSDGVARSLDGPVLRYSQRLALLRRAAELGISRFEANLLIAAVQHRQPVAPNLDASSAAPPRRANLPAMVAFALGVQTLIALALWRLFGA